MNRQKSILAVGAHVGDMELTSGGLLATCSRLGWKVVLVTLTSSERSAPEGVDLKQVKQTKVKEAAAFARVLGAESIVLGHSGRFLKAVAKGQLSASRPDLQEYARDCSDPLCQSP